MISYVQDLLYVNACFLEPLDLMVYAAIKGSAATRVALAAALF